MIGHPGALVALDHLEAGCGVVAPTETGAGGDRNVSAPVRAQRIECGALALAPALEARPVDRPGGDLPALRAVLERDSKCVCHR